MRPPARTGLAALGEPAGRAFVVHVRAGGRGAGCWRWCSAVESQPFHPLGLCPALLAHGGCVPTRALVALGPASSPLRPLQPLWISGFRFEGLVNIS